jgi:heptosyltransferase-1
MNVLLVKMSSLGDVVHALPAVTDAIRCGHSVDWVVEEAFADIARMHAGVSKVIPIAWRRWRKSIAASRSEIRDFRDVLREARYDLVLDSQGLIKSAVVSRWARSRARAGFSRQCAREPLAALAYGIHANVARKQHAVDRQRQLFAKVLDYDLDAPIDTGLVPGAVHTGRVFLLHGTTWPTKHWPDSMWIALAKLVANAGMCPTLTWGDDAERQRAECIAQAVDGVVVIARAPLRDLALDLATSQLVIGVDSGLTHLSAALGVPTLGLYGPTDAQLTGCRGSRADTLQSQLACSPCLQQRCSRYGGEPLIWEDAIVDPPCFAQLEPQRVWAQATALLESCELDP